MSERATDRPTYGPACFGCGHYDGEHTGSGCAVIVIRNERAEYTCPCNGFVPMSVEVCEEWLNNPMIFNRGEKVERVVRFLLQEVAYCDAYVERERTLAAYICELEERNAELREAAIRLSTTPKKAWERRLGGEESPLSEAQRDANISKAVRKFGRKR